MARKITRLEDLATLAGVSIATVSRALNDSPAINLATKQRIWKLARENNYPFRRYMPAGPIGARATIAIVVPKPQSREGQLDDPFFLELFAGVGEAARERGCDVIVSHVSPSTYEDLATLMTTSRAAGVIFLGQSTLHREFNQLAETESAFVVWGAQLPDQTYCSVGSDNVEGGRRATAHLARLGRRRIVFLGDTEAPEAGQRLQGYYDALRQATMTVDPALVVPSHFEVESAAAAADALLARDGRREGAFDGIVAVSDLVALGAIRALTRAGVRVPQDVSVVGYDNVPFARYSTPALTTISQNTSRAGRLLVTKLLAASATDEIRSERIATDLIVRESCGG
ncbi:LacI family DNA-binding transcriptional regulator [uncultured Sphingomonas sp.]|uniref:LacI family DNA-binding transcriptional regulator n=1 Tax=uncultured Sphingomonas sp. TaxID=158754 RepID=UPI0035CB8C5C